MADLSQVTALLVSLAGDAIYPNGTGSPSVSGNPVHIYEGWPIPDRLDQDIQGKTRDANGIMQPNGIGPISHISVFPLNSGSATITGQVFEDPVVVTPAVHGITAIVSPNAVTLSGVPSSGEYVSIIADGKHAYSRTGATLSAILSALLTDIQADYPTASLEGGVLTIPAGSLVARSGAPATLGRLIHRQKQQVMVTVWAPTPAERSALAAPLDVYLKQNLRVTFPDQSQGILTFERTTQIDDRQTEAVYRRDLVYSVEYGTLETFTAYEVTSVTSTFDTSGNGLQADVGASTTFAAFSGSVPSTSPTSRPASDGGQVLVQ